MGVTVRRGVPAWLYHLQRGKRTNAEEHAYYGANMLCNEMPETIVCKLRCRERMPHAENTDAHLWDHGISLIGMTACKARTWPAQTGPRRWHPPWPPGSRRRSPPAGVDSAARMLSREQEKTRAHQRSRPSMCARPAAQLLAGPGREGCPQEASCPDARLAVL